MLKTLGVMQKSVENCEELGMGKLLLQGAWFRAVLGGQMLAIARFGVWTCHGFAPVLFPLPGRGAKTGAVGPAPFLLHFFFRLLPGCGTKTGAVEPPQVLPQLPSPSRFQDA